MKNQVAAIHVDRLAHALSRQGVNLKRAKIIEISAAAFGYHNSNEFQAAARSGDLDPPMSEVMEVVSLSDGSDMIVLRVSGSDLSYAIDRRAIEGTDRASRYGISPYGGLCSIPAATEIPCHVGPTLHNGAPLVGLDDLSTLVEAADAYADYLAEEVTDDDRSQADRDQMQEFLDAINGAVTKARGTYGAMSPADDRNNDAADGIVSIRREVLESLLSAAESHVDDAVSGVEEGIYDASENGWTLSLQEHIDEAKKVVDMLPEAALQHSPQAIADALEAAISSDIWTGVQDEEATLEVVEAKLAMKEAARLLRGQSSTSSGAAKGKTSGEAEPRWLSDVDGDVIYGTTREELESLELDYMRGDGKNDWHPLTETEMSYLQPGAHIPNPGISSGGTMWTPDINGIEVRLGQSCLWKGRKWMVPCIEFSFGEDEKDHAFRQLESYVQDLQPLVSRLGGEIRIHADATDYSHEIDIFLPMDLAMEFPGTEDWGRALEWLFCPAGKRDRLAIVKATFNTATTSPGYVVEWDATFDVLKEGSNQMMGYMFGEDDAELAMRIAESPLAHKDAWALWNEDWPLELDMQGINRLYSKR